MTQVACTLARKRETTFYSVTDEVEIRFKHAMWTRVWTFYPQDEKFDSNFK